MFSDLVAIDPLALILPTSVYLAIQDKINPHQPVMTALTEAAKNLTPEQKTFVQARIRTLNTYTGAVAEALSGKAAGAKG